MFGLLLALGFLAALFQTYRQSLVLRVKAQADQPAETRVIKKQDKGPGKDSLITHYRIWQDYDGHQYEGRYTFSTAVWHRSHFLKEQLAVADDNETSYNRVVAALSRHDEQQLSSLYQYCSGSGNARMVPLIK